MSLFCLPAVPAGDPLSNAWHAASFLAPRIMRSSNHHGGGMGMGIPRTPAELRVWAADEIQELETRRRNVARTTVDGRPPGTGRKMVCSESFVVMLCTCCGFPVRLHQAAPKSASAPPTSSTTPPHPIKGPVAPLRCGKGLQDHCTVTRVGNRCNCKEGGGG